MKESIRRIERRTCGRDTGTTGNDLLLGNNGNTIIEGLEGDDVVMSDIGNDVIDGGAGNDVVFASIKAANDAVFEITRVA